MGTGSPFGVISCLRTKQRQRSQYTACVLKGTELFTLKWLISCYMNATSVKVKKYTKSTDLNKMGFYMECWSQECIHCSEVTEQHA